MLSHPVGQPDEPKYSGNVFKAVLEALGSDAFARQALEIKEDGVWERPNPAGANNCWHPLSEMLERGSPNPDDEPLLPDPFTAKELAAFMVDGLGKWFIQWEFGDWDSDPGHWLKACRERLAGKAREAMTDAYAAYLDAATAEDHLWPDDVRQLAVEHRVALSELQRFDLNNEQDYESPQYLELRERERLLDIQLGNAREPDRGAGRQWRKAVVRRLLSTQSVGPAEDGSANESSSFGSRVRWLQGLEELLPVIAREKGKSDVMTVIREMKARGKTWGILQDGPPDGLCWKDRQGSRHTVEQKTISNAISRIKKKSKGFAS